MRNTVNIYWEINGSLYHCAVYVFVYFGFPGGFPISRWNCCVPTIPGRPAFYDSAKRIYKRNC